jgi:hypothetical protein
MVLEGSVTVEILPPTDRHRLPLTADQFTVVPPGHCQRHTDAHDVVEMFRTPVTALGPLPTIPGSRPRNASFPS